MSFKGININAKNRTALKVVYGFKGIRIRVSAKSVKITDYRGRGLANVELIATNPTSGIPFTGYTDASGSVFMSLDNVTDIVITKNLLTKTIQYNGELSPTYQIDLPFIQNNRSGGWLRDWVEIVRANYTTRVTVDSGTIEDEEELLNWLRE